MLISVIAGSNSTLGVGEILKMARKVSCPSTTPSLWMLMRAHMRSGVFRWKLKLEGEGVLR